MAQCNLAEIGQPVAREQGQRQLRLLRDRPEPIDRAVRGPGSIVRLVEVEAHAQYAPQLLPARNQRWALRLFDRRVAEDRETARISLHRLDGLLVGVGVPARGGMENGAVDS